MACLAFIGDRQSGGRRDEASAAATSGEKSASLLVIRWSFATP
jgi:hypothetical protein